MDALIISNGLDTNGQNTRYVRAAEKHGDHPDVINALAIGNADPGGVVGRLQAAALRHDVGIRIRSAHRHVEYFQFPSDLRWGREATAAANREVRRIAQAADLIHLNNSDIALRHMGLRRDKPLLLHHHGSLFRGNPQKMLDTAKAGRMVQAVSTIDLQRPAPDLLTWLPTAYDVDQLEEFGRDNGRPPDGRVRVVHCPTNRELKHTELFLEAVRQLQEEGLPIDLHLVERETWRDSLLAKAGADIVYDQLAWGYGCNGVEAWGMGKPVLAGADPWTFKRMVGLWGTTPFYAATEKNLKQKLRALILSADLRAEYGERGHQHVRTYHDELPALMILADLYNRAMAAKIRPRIKGKGVQFRSAARARLMHVDGMEVKFVNGVATVTDVEVANRLRKMAKDRPKFGIEEVA